MAYTDPRLGGAVAWVIPDEPSDIAKGTYDDRDSTVEFPIDELQIYGGGHVGFVFQHCPTCNIDIRILDIFGEKNGRLHVGFNQTLYIINGRLPVDLAIYRSGLATMHGELKVVGVTVWVEGKYAMNGWMVN